MRVYFVPQLLRQSDRVSNRRNTRDKYNCPSLLILDFLLYSQSARSYRSIRDFVNIMLCIGCLYKISSIHFLLHPKAINTNSSYRPTNHNVHQPEKNSYFLTTEKMKQRTVNKQDKIKKKGPKGGFSSLSVLLTRSLL